jgi:hypothetical protein
MVGGILALIAFGKQDSFPTSDNDNGNDNDNGYLQNNNQNNNQ